MLNMSLVRHSVTDMLIVAVCALSTLRRCWCRQPGDQLSVTARFLWLQRGRSTVCRHRDQGRLLATDISAGDQVSSYPSIIWLMEVWRCLC